MRTLCVFSLLCLAATTTAWGQQQAVDKFEDARQLMNEGDALRVDNHWFEADEKYEKVVQVCPEWEKAWVVFLENRFFEMYSVLDDPEKKYQWLADTLRRAENAAVLHPHSCEIPFLIAHVLSIKFNFWLSERDIDYLDGRFFEEHNYFSSEDAIHWYKVARANKPHSKYSNWFLDFAGTNVYMAAIRKNYERGVKLGNNFHKNKAFVHYLDFVSNMKKVGRLYAYVGYSVQTDHQIRRATELWKELTESDPQK